MDFDVNLFDRACGRDVWGSILFALALFECMAPAGPCDAQACAEA